MSNEDEIRFKLDDVFSHLYIKLDARSIVAACELAGISDKTFYSWDAKVREDVQANVMQRALALRQEDEEALQREKSELRARLLRKSYALLERGVEHLDKSLDDDKTGAFVADKIVNTLIDLIRNELLPDKRGIIIKLPGDESERPKQVAAPVPQRLRPPGDIQPADSVQLASEFKQQTYTDGMKVETRVVMPDVVEGK